MEADEQDVYLDRVLIGGRERGEIAVVDYDPVWANRFEHERNRVRQALGPVALRVEHIGSTAVPGLAAKPVIDVLVTVEDPDDDATLAPRLESAGYELRVREPGHRMFRTPTRDVHVHVWADNDPEVEGYLVFRDQLRRSPKDRLAYERLKRDLARREWSDVNEYADAKSELIKAVLAKAGATLPDAASPDGRDQEVREITMSLTAWAKQHGEIRALAMVGSRARGTPRRGSDLDVLILTDTPTRFTESDDWLDVLDQPPMVRRARFGAMTERRVQLPSGLEIEFGITEPAWASTVPLDRGTARVARDGLRALYDPEGLLAKLQAAVRAAGNR